MEDITISENKDKIKPFYAIKIFEKGKEIDPTGKKTIHLSLGEPSVSLPKKLLDHVGKKLLKKKNWLHRVYRSIRTTKRNS